MTSSSVAMSLAAAILSCGLGQEIYFVTCLCCLLLNFLQDLKAIRGVAIYPESVVLGVLPVAQEGTGC